MAGIDELRNVFKEGLKKAKYLMLSVSPGIWIDADAFKCMENGVLFLRKGHSSGFVHKDVFEKIQCKKPMEVQRKEGS